MQQTTIFDFFEIKKEKADPKERLMNSLKSICERNTCKKCPLYMGNECYSQKYYGMKWKE